jgi:CDP-diacylglycerol--glycerol-3-phosphate 3-phosphatidyltransferase
MSGVTVSGRVSREWWAIVALFGVVAGVGAYRTAGVVGLEVAAGWVVVTSAVAVGELVYLRRNLSRNHPEGRPGERFGRLGLPNLITVLRGLCIAALAGFAVVPPASGVRWLPAICYGVAVGLDYLDGSVARLTDRRTVLGGKLDLAIDTLGFLVAPIVAVAWGRLPVWYLSLAAARYSFKLACWQRSARGHPVDDLPPSRVRRYLAAGQMGFLTIALAPLLARETIDLVAPLVLLPSLTFFVRDYLTVTRRL